MRLAAGPKKSQRGRFIAVLWVHRAQVGLGDNRTFLHELTGGKTKADVRWPLDSSPLQPAGSASV